MSTEKNHISILGALKESFRLVIPLYDPIFRRILTFLLLIIFILVILYWIFRIQTTFDYQNHSIKYIFFDYVNGEYPVLKIIVSILFNWWLIAFFSAPIIMIGIKKAMGLSATEQEIKAAICPVKLQYHILCFLSSLLTVCLKNVIDFLQITTFGNVYLLALKMTICYPISILIEFYAIPFLVLKNQSMLSALENAYHTLIHYWAKLFLAYIIATLAIFWFFFGAYGLLFDFTEYLSSLPISANLELGIRVVGFIALWALFFLFILPIGFAYNCILYRQINQDEWFCSRIPDSPLSLNSYNKKNYRNEDLF